MEQMAYRIEAGVRCQQGLWAFPRIGKVSQMGKKPGRRSHDIPFLCKNPRHLAMGYIPEFFLPPFDWKTIGSDRAALLCSPKLCGRQIEFEGAFLFSFFLGACAAVLVGETAGRARQTGLSFFFFFPLTTQTEQPPDKEAGRRQQLGIATDADRPGLAYCRRAGDGGGGWVEFSQFRGLVEFKTRPGAIELTRRRRSGGAADAVFLSVRALLQQADEGAGIHSPTFSNRRQEPPPQ